MTGATDSVGLLGGVPGQGGDVACTHITGDCATVTAVVLEGETEGEINDS